MLLIQPSFTREQSGLVTRI